MTGRDEPPEKGPSQPVQFTLATGYSDKLQGRQPPEYTSVVLLISAYQIIPP